MTKKATTDTKKPTRKLRRAITTHQAAELCECHFTSIIRWIHEGKIKAYSTPGGHRRIMRPDLVAFLNAHEMPVPGELA